MTTSMDAPIFSAPSNSPHKAWEPIGSTRLPSARSSLDESNPAHREKIAQTAQ